MLLHRLVKQAEQDPAAKPFHRMLRFDWELRLNPDGTLAGDGLESLLAPDAAGKLRGAEHFVPAVTRTVGVAPNLAADDVQYVLGWADPDSKPARVAQCHDAFVALTRQWAQSPAGQNDPIAQALDRFYRSGEAARVRRDPEATAKQRVLITVGPTAAYRAESVSEFWTAEVTRRKGGGNHGLCLVCGKTRPLLDTLPGKVPARLVPGASNDAALVSVNERVFGYDLTSQLTCSPICIPCGEGVSAGLVRVLDSANTTSYNGQDSRLAWWTTEPTKRNPMKLILDADPGQVTALIFSIHNGKTAPEIKDTNKFCALTVGGNVARVVVRDWLEMPLSTVEKNVGEWFADLDIATLHPDETARQPLQRLVRVTGRWQRTERRYAFIGAKGSAHPHAAQRDLLNAALRKTTLPPSLLIHLLNRVRTDGRLDTPRAALLRLMLLRSHLTTETPMPGLDESNTNPAYVAGRVFAALDALQYDAFDGKINTTYANRYLAGAITNPRAALLAGSKLADAWLRKFRGARKGAAVNHSRELTTLYGLFDAADGIPHRTTPAQQALFLLGYHHQRAHRFAVLRDRAAARATTTETSTPELSAPEAPATEPVTAEFDQEINA
ncbi:CRISPR-associated protein, Csd1 family [Lentzea xinjiangensis]|uniref:CRISPR-associated protein, Csd1 family n=1 Tax=Lentzea xinjiangensis TaxID=402600 RepID=A0A1H9RYQ8_9PSEU|nr:type I-C CRISPR-associated protein Cas8c/Csd1 [Lentzea xinjiangensis]SER77926.1 CRISPR-associated protein, Csd1 family [Lentzea xinjiangensis]